MSEEATAGPPATESAPQGLDAILSSAIEAAEAPAEATDSTVSADRARDESGRFKAKDSTVAEAPDKGPAEAADKATTETKAEPATVQPVEPPARLSPEQKAQFATWPRDAQEAFAARHKEIEADHTRKSQELSSFRSQAEPLLKAVEPHQAYLAQLASQAGTTPASLVHDVLTAERTLRSGTPEQKVTALLQIAADYGIDLRGVAGGGQAQQLDPLTQDMRQTVSQLANRVAEQEQRHLVAENERIAVDIASFASAKDASGNLLRPYFEQVRPIMGQMMQNGQAATLDEAYSKAIQPFQAMITAEVKAKDAAAEKARLEAVEKAKRAAPVRSTGSQPGGSVQGKGLDAHLNAAFAKAGVA